MERQLINIYYSLNSAARNNWLLKMERQLINQDYIIALIAAPPTKYGAAID